jgi:hypothetical protein
MIYPRLCALESAVAFILLLNSMSLSQDRLQTVIGTPDNQFRVVNSYPEYWVDGKPFFEHAAAFFYHRLPRDRWAEELIRLRSMGINTIDLYPLWNWHQPEEALLDFDGRTNPRRDLKYLLRLITVIGFKITVRPGPYFTAEWRNGGYPDWLLRRPEYQQSEQSILEGRYPRLSALQRVKSDEAALGWMKNDTHLRHTRKWYHDVLSLFNPLLAEKGGPVINIQIDDDQASFRENYHGPNFWKYMDLLRGFAKEATGSSRIPYYLNGYDMRVNPEANDSTSEPFWNTGQDYPGSDAVGCSTALEAAKNKFLLEVLKTQPMFVPGHIEFQAGWYLNQKDTYAQLTDPSNTLMATRVMFQNGLKMLNYYPMNDTLYPAGYEFPSANYFYSWEAAINYAGKETARAPYVRRNGRLLAGMGSLLASSHLLPDAGLVYPMATFSQTNLTAEEINLVANFAGRVLWSGVYEHYNFELVDSDHSPLQNFERYKILLLPNLLNSEEALGHFPHLDQYSEKAQRLVRDYVTAGGTLIAFPSLPKGTILGDLFAPLGNDRRKVGDSSISFSGGKTALTLGSHSVLTLPKNQDSRVKVFARDAQGEIIGARITYGKGQIMFFGADFSRWSVPTGTVSFTEVGASGDARDYPEEVQKAARRALPALLAEAGALRKVYPEMETTKARDIGLYVTELIADWDSRPFEQRGGQQPGYGFVGVSNFGIQEVRTTGIFLTDPRTSDLCSAGTDRYLHLPPLTLPPRESVMLPVRLPLSNPIWQTAPGLQTTDEVYYATVELTRVAYDGATLRFELNAPAEGELALRLANRPLGAKLDNETTLIRQDQKRRLFTVSVPKGKAPHYVRTIELEYPSEQVRIRILPQEPWIAGELCTVRLEVQNLRSTPLEGNLDFTAPALHKRESSPPLIRVPPHSSRRFIFRVEVPADAAENQPVGLIATFREKNSPTPWAWQSRVLLHRPFGYTLGPYLNFPLRVDQSIPIVHPILMSLSLPGEATFQLRLKNWRQVEDVVKITTEGSGLVITPSSSPVVLPADGETTVQLRATPEKGSGLYRFDIHFQSGTYTATEGVLLVAIRPGEAVAYPLDYDRDGFEDLILENQQVRLFLSPHAGGRSFAFELKDSGVNAFNSVGGMRDSFTTRIEPQDQAGLPDWTRTNWHGLYNRPYSFQILSNSTTQAQVRLQYTAPDVYPKGVKLERTLLLRGDQNVVVASTTVTPLGIEKPQAYVLESSVPFQSFNDPNYNQWFSHGRSNEDFIPHQKTDLGSKVGFIGTLNKKSGQTFAVLMLTPAESSQLVVEGHSALIRILYPPFTVRNHASTYDVAYFLGRSTQQEITDLYTKLKAGRR